MDSSYVLIPLAVAAWLAGWLWRRRYLEDFEASPLLKLVSRRRLRAYSRACLLQASGWLALFGGFAVYGARQGDDWPTVLLFTALGLFFTYNGWMIRRAASTTHRSISWQFTSPSLLVSIIKGYYKSEENLEGGLAQISVRPSIGDSHVILSVGSTNYSLEVVGRGLSASHVIAAVMGAAKNGPTRLIVSGDTTGRLSLISPSFQNN